MQSFFHKDNEDFDQTDLSHRWMQISEDIFSHIATHVFFIPYLLYCKYNLSG